MLTIELYNQLRGTHFAATEHNMALINKLNSLGVTETEVKAYQMPPGSRQHEMRQMASDMARTHVPGRKPAATPAIPATPAVKEEGETTPMTTPNTEALNAALTTLAGILGTPQIDEEKMRKIIEQTVDEKIKDVRPTRIEVKTPTGLREIKGQTHAAFKDVLDYIANGDAVYIYGPAGTGKTHMAQQIADALGLKFYYSGQLSQEYQFTGYTDAMGRYVPTPFYEAFREDGEGGFMFFDELDRSCTDVPTRLNAALANGYFDFPAPIGRVKMHPKFRVMAAGNTFGRGATGVYTAANQLDASTLNRFAAFIEVNYDKRIEDAIDPEAAEFVRGLRKASARAGLDIILSYRQIKTLAKYAALRGEAKVIKEAITAPLTRDDINNLKASPEVRSLVDKGNKFAKALA